MFRDRVVSVRFSVPRYGFRIVEASLCVFVCACLVFLVFFLSFFCCSCFLALLFCYPPADREHIQIFPSGPDCLQEMMSETRLRREELEQRVKGFDAELLGIRAR